MPTKREAPRRVKWGPERLWVVVNVLDEALYAEASRRGALEWMRELQAGTGDPYRVIAYDRATERGKR